MLYVSPIITLALTIFALFVWRQQLFAKRQFEVAEEAGTAFGRAERALSDIRLGFFSNAELSSALDNTDVNLNDPRRKYNAYAIRIQAQKDAFDKLENARLLCEHRLGKNAVEALATLEKVKSNIIAAVEMLYGPVAQQVIPTSPGAADVLRIQTEARAILMNAPGTPYDSQSAVIEAAKTKLRRACKPYLRNTSWSYIRAIGAFVTIVSIVLVVWLALTTIRLEQYSYNGQLQNCYEAGDYSKDIALRDKREKCLRETNPRTSDWYHLLYALGLI